MPASKPSFCHPRRSARGSSTRATMLSPKLVGTDETRKSTLRPAITLVIRPSCGSRRSETFILGGTARRPPRRPAVSGASPSGAGRIEPGRVAAAAGWPPRASPALPGSPAGCRGPVEGHVRSSGPGAGRSRNRVRCSGDRVLRRSCPWLSRRPYSASRARGVRPGRVSRHGLSGTRARAHPRASSLWRFRSRTMARAALARPGAGPLQAENRPLQGLRFPRLRRGASDFPLDRIAARPGRFLSKRAERGEHHA
jgi:hypothetical protein